MANRYRNTIYIDKTQVFCYYDIVKTKNKNMNKHIPITEESSTEHITVHFNLYYEEL